jgi:hypothetical protein
MTRGSRQSACCGCWKESKNVDEGIEVLLRGWVYYGQLNLPGRVVVGVDVAGQLAQMRCRVWLHIVVLWIN